MEEVQSNALFIIGACTKSRFELSLVSLKNISDNTLNAIPKIEYNATMAIID
jgi:hypothetical protein